MARRTVLDQAHEALGAGRLSTNLVPKEIVIDRIINRKKPWAVAAATLLALGCLISFLILWFPWYKVRIDADPNWIDGYFDRQIVGGPLLDLHVHDAHFIRALFGMPENVVASGRLRNGLVEYFSSLMSFSRSGFVVNCNGGVINQQGRPFTHGFEIHFEDATVQLPRIIPISLVQIFVTFPDNRMTSVIRLTMWLVCTGRL